MWQYFNNNPVGIVGVGDCAVRAVSKALDLTWEEAYARLSLNGFLMGDMPSSDLVSGALLREAGFRREVIPNTCPQCYTAEQFCNDHPSGTYVLKSDNHLSTIVNGVIYDSFDNSMSMPVYYWYKPNEQKG